MLFSAAQLHSTVPNTCGITRYSIDFRTVHVDDVWTKAGAINIDSAATGTTMRDYIRATDYPVFPMRLWSLYNDGTEVEFVPSPTAPSRAHAPMSTSTGRTADDNHAVTQSTKKFNSAQ